MARSPAQRGKVGNWLVESRMARGWDTQALAREQIAKLTGWTIPQSVYAEWESGRRLPSEANLDRLRSFYGDAPGATETPDALVQALLAQTAAISALVEEMRLARGVLPPEVAAAIAAAEARNALRPRSPAAQPSGEPPSDTRPRKGVRGVDRPRTPNP